MVSGAGHHTCPPSPTEVWTSVLALSARQMAVDGQGPTCTSPSTTFRGGSHQEAAWRRGGSAPHPGSRCVPLPCLPGPFAVAFQADALPGRQAGAAPTMAVTGRPGAHAEGARGKPERGRVARLGGASALPGGLGRLGFGPCRQLSVGASGALGRVSTWPLAKQQCLDGHGHSCPKHQFSGSLEER